MKIEFFYLFFAFAELFGTKVYLNVEMAQCRKGINCDEQIGDIGQVADFIGAASSNQVRYKHSIFLNLILKT